MLAHKVVCGHGKEGPAAISPWILNICLAFPGRLSAQLLVWKPGANNARTNPQSPLKEVHRRRKRQCYNMIHNDDVTARPLVAFLPYRVRARPRFLRRKEDRKPQSRQSLPISLKRASKRNGGRGPEARKEGPASKTGPVPKRTPEPSGPNGWAVRGADLRKRQAGKPEEAARNGESRVILWRGNQT